MTAIILLARLPLELIGSTAAVCTTISFVPQLIRVWQRKSARDISMTMFLLFSFGVGCWLVYGIGIRSGPIIAANAVTLALALAILVLKVRCDAKRRDSSRESDSFKIEA
jgi:MtN3 and saliva related transmembrane protein